MYREVGEGVGREGGRGGEMGEFLEQRIFNFG